MSQTLNPKFTGRVSQLDALRGIAALAVVLFHFTFGFDNGYRILSEDKFYFRYGYLGVQLFFMISGFVILMTIDKTKHHFDFIVSRFSRLYPVYWVCILITVLATFLMQVPKQQGMYSVSQVLVNFTMLQSFFKVKDVDGAYWTLAIELVFYFWMWLMFITGSRKNIIVLSVIWVSLACFSFIKLIPYQNLLNIILILPHAPFFVAGICFYLLQKEGNKPVFHALIAFTFIANCIILYFNTFSYTGNTKTIPFIMYPVFYAVFYLFPKMSFLKNRIFVFFGAISYPLYLIHEVIGSGIIYWTRKFTNVEFFYVMVPLIITVSLGYLLHITVEIPVTKKIRDAYKNYKERKKMKELVNVSAVPSEITLE